VKDVRAGSAGANISQLTNVSGRLFFVADDGTTGRELWQSDGTSAGTQLVQDIRTGLDAGNFPRSSNPAGLTNLNGTLFFSAEDSSGGRELWKSTGLGGETTRVSDIAPGAASSSPEGLVARGNDLFFSAVTAGGRELWRAQSQRPVLTIPANTLTYTEDGPARRLATTATLTDFDTPVLAGGRLTIAITNASAGDRLVLLPVAAISTVGNLVLHNGVVIGRFSGGVDRVALTIELNQNAALPAVQSLVRSVAYQTASDTPSTQQRTIRFYLTDGEGAAALAQSVQLNVVPHNDAPVVGLSGTIGYVHDQAAVTLAPGASVRDVDSSDFALGRLRVWIDLASATNRLEIGGGFTVDGANDVLLGGTVIGRRTSSGIGTSELIVVFNANATPAMVQQLVRAITFRTVGGAAGQRSVNFTVSDGDGGVSAQASKLVNVT
jgi:ELWxxDGT repeat protein